MRVEELTDRQLDELYEDVCAERNRRLQMEANKNLKRQRNNLVETK